MCRKGSDKNCSNAASNSNHTAQNFTDGYSVLSYDIIIKKIKIIRTKK